MTTTNFIDRQTPILASWLNDVDRAVYEYLDVPIARANRLVVGFDDDLDITNNASALANNSMLLRYSTDYAESGTLNGIQVQRFIAADVGSTASSFKSQTILGAPNGSDTPIPGPYQPEWGVNIEIDSYSTAVSATTPTVGVSSTVRRWNAQGVMAIHCNAMDMRIPASATDPNMGGITGMEAHSDGVGPDHRTSGGSGYGYRQTIRCTARTKETSPTWAARGTTPYGNGAVVAKDDICLPKNASLATLPYQGPYFVCHTAGTLGGVDTILDATTTPLTTVTDGTAIWECRIGAEIGVALKIKNGDCTDTPNTGGYYRYGIIIDNALDDLNPNQIDTAIYINNSGTFNFYSYGDPDYHVYCRGATGTSDFTLDRETLVAGDQIGQFAFRAFTDAGVSREYAKVAGYALDLTDGAEVGRISIQTYVAGVNTNCATFKNGDVIAGNEQVLATTDTTGFLHIGRCAGVPTGVPTLYTGKCPMVVDSTNGRLYVYHTGAWHYATLT